MSIVMELNPYITDTSDATVYGETRIGDNGDLWGAPEYDIGTSSTSQVGYTTWDSAPYDGIDSGWVNVTLHLTSSGASLYVENGGDGTLSLTNAQFGAISKVEIDAATQTSGVSVAWRALSVEFFKNGSATEGINVPTNKDPVADGTNATGPIEAITTVTPTAANNDEVIVSGQVYIHADSGNYPSGNDIFSQILVYAPSA
ncbi:MAG TPA: hypothetical protein VIL86_01345 [Tepidisphaeraceae bacterium]|jgi:hypothetical protein